MSQKRNEDSSRYPALGRWLAGIDDKPNVDRIVYGLFTVCALLFAADFLYPKHTELAVEKIPGFYALYGFFMCAGLVIAAKGLRILVKRSEDYYAPYEVDSEAYPEDQLGRIDHDG